MFMTIKRQLISILALLVVLQIAKVVVVPLRLAFTTTISLQSHASLSTCHNYDALTTNANRKKLLASGIPYHQHISRHNIKQLTYGNTNVQLNLVPISDAWDCNISHDKQQASSFASLLPTLGCNSFNSQGMLIQTPSSENDNKQGDIVNNNQYRLYLATNIDDLPSITKLTLEVFDATAITLSSSSTNWTAFEQVLVGKVVSPVLDMYNSYAQAVGYTEVLSGLRKRMRNRLVNTDQMIMNNNGGEDGNIGDTEKYDWLAPLIFVDKNDDHSTTTTSDSSSSLEEIAARSSLILTLARPSSESGDDDDMEAVASVELRLQPTDAKIPFSQPWLDVVERRLVNLLPFVKEDDNESTKSSSSTSNVQSTDTTSKNNNQSRPPLRPYLCNLCVSSSLRSLGIGRALCRIVEAIARDKWGYSHVYLHVDPTNDAARNLYVTEGYVDVGKRWNVLWAGGANEISYYVKRL